MKRSFQKADDSITPTRRTRQVEEVLPTSPKRRRRTNTREALLIAARTLLAGRITEGFTIDDVVQSAGVAKGSFYNHFSDKEELTQEVSRLIRNKEEAEIEAANRHVTEPAAKIARGMAVYARFALTSPEEARIMTLAHVDALSVKSSMNAGLVRDLAEGLRSGKFVIPSIETGALLVIGQTAVLLARLKSGIQRGDAGVLAQQCIALTLLGLGLEYKMAHLISAQATEDILREASTSLDANST